MSQSYEIKRSESGSKYVEIELEHGDVVRIHGVPPSLNDIIETKHPKPQPPVIETRTASGSVVVTVNEEDPDYLAALAECEKKQERLYLQLYTLSMFRDVKVPDCFDLDDELGEVIRFAMPDWEPDTSPGQRKLDYIRNILLESRADQLAVNRAAAFLNGIDMKEVENIEDSFRSDMDGETD